MPRAPRRWEGTVLACGASACALWMVGIVLAALGCWARGAGIGLAIALLALTVAALLALAAALARSVRRHHRPWPAWTTRGCGLALVALPLALGWRHHLHPAQPVAVYDDQGTYCLTALTIARTGGSRLPTPLLAITPPDLHHLLTTPVRPMALANDGRAPRVDEFHFSFVRPASTADGGDHRLDAVFPIGYPVLLAAFASLGDWPALGSANAVLSTLSAGLLGLLAMRWLGAVAAVSAFVLLLVNPLQVWAANTLHAEPAVQALWLLALVALVHARSGALAPALVGTACVLGLALKVDALPVALLPPLIALGAWRDQRRVAIPMLAAWACALPVVAWLWMPHAPYLAGTLMAMARTAAPTGLCLLAPLAAVALAIHLSPSASALRLAPRSATLRMACILLLLAAAGHAYAIRPHATPPDAFFFWPEGRTIRSFRELTFVRLGWYLHPLGLLVATAGTCLLVWRSRARAELALLAIGIGATCLFCYDLFNKPLQPYAMRRFVPHALPMIILALAATWREATRLERPAPRRAAGTLTALGVAALVWHGSLINGAWWQESGHQGLAHRLTAFAGTLPAPAVLIVNRREGLDAFAPFLQVACGTLVAVRDFTRGDEQRAGWERAIAAWRRHGRRVLYLTRYDGAPRLTHRPLALLHEGVIAQRSLLSREDALPRGQATLVRRYRLFEIGEPPTDLATDPDR